MKEVGYDNILRRGREENLLLPHRSLPLEGRLRQEMREGVSPPQLRERNGANSGGRGKHLRRLNMCEP